MSEEKCLLTDSGLPNTWNEEQKTKKPKRTLNCLTLGFLAYFAVAAGPFGIEEAVKAAGPFPVLLAVLILPFTWGLPQALMTAELSSMMSENGGYILWVNRGLGEFAGFLNAFNSCVCNLFDLPTYPVLFASYVQAFLIQMGFHHLSTLELWIVKLAAVVFVSTSNLVGIKIVAVSAVFMTIIVLMPFFLELIMVAPTLGIKKFEASAYPSIDWSLFLSTILWNYQGWDSLGCIAGEVQQNGGRTYPIAVTIALILITLNYFVPVAAGIVIDPDYNNWTDGYLVTLAVRTSKWLGTWVALAAIVSTLGEFNVVMGCSSRALWATANYKILPKFLTKESERLGTPYAAILFQTVTTCILMSFSFSSLVIFDTFLNNLTLILEFLSYLRLKYTEPNTERQFVVYGGNLGAWVITLPKVVILLLVLLAQNSTVWITCGIFNIVVICIYFVWKKSNKFE